jgi:ectoine hydroxylase-related dioxygenase (phytanoyl-CoA dioxygenase family)
MRIQEERTIHFARPTGITMKVQHPGIGYRLISICILLLSSAFLTAVESLIVAGSLTLPNTPTRFIHRSHRPHRDAMSFAISPGAEGCDFESSEPPGVWMSRRGMIQTTLTASAAAAFGFDVSYESSTESPSSSWMAAPDKSLVSDASQLKTDIEYALSQVTAENMRQYQTDGVTVVRNVVPQRWIEALRMGCELAQDNAGPYAEYLQQATDEGIFFTDLELGRRLPLFSTFCQYSPVAAVAGTIMGSQSVRYLYDQLFVKEKGVSTHTPWHQDGGYWRVHGMQIGSAFVPLDPVDEGDGLDFVLGSQHWTLHNPQHFADGTPYKGTSLPPMPDVDQLVQSKQAYLQTFALKPGDLLVFSSRTVHGGPGNWGRALSTRWVGDDAAFWARPGEGAVPTGDVGLKDGERLAHNSNAFPEIWHA